MARIIDKDTRLIDIDFGGLDIGITRTATQPFPTSQTATGNGRSQLLNEVLANNRGAGSFIQYDRLDLSHMVMNNEVMLPVEISVQRTSPVPLGFSNNGNMYDQIEEYIYVFSRPLNNTNLAAITNISADYEGMRDMGLDGSEGITSAIMTDVAGVAGWPTQAQTIYAEKRMYSVNLNNAATLVNGALDPTVPGTNSLTGMPMLDTVTTWGSMGALTGPNLHAYRVVISRAQDLSGTPPLSTLNESLAGTASYSWPPVRIAFLCKDPNFSEGEYLTRIANAMNSIPEGGDTA